ncbi:T9SS type B sorting domain-containing protein [Niastella sp. OAS944]|uniref:T9SS type B sorting domain-containing protein n=1 Tax=Niastella sp. OAS944 TaxID=2664089 RepID=UPI0035C7F2AB
MSGCDSIATLVLTVSPTLTSTTNTAICTNQLPYIWNGQTINATGTYTANLTSVSGCDSIATLVLTVSPTLTSTTNTAICTNQLPYSWNGQTINAPGTYTANLTSVSGCDSIATLVLTATPTLTSTTNTAICTNQLPYTWNGQTINAAGTYTANLTSVSGCDSIATLVLTASPTLTSTTNTAICTNQLPYTWNGQTINAAGTYTANLTSVSGCDSIATLVLAVSPTLTSTTNTAICTNQLPYTWNGQTINAAGTYTANLTSVSGCDSVATLVLAVNPTLTSTTNTAICTNQLPYTWNGQTINAGGTYTANLTSVSGCDSIATLVLTVSPTLTSTTNTAICTNQLPYTWNGQTINAAGTYTANLTSMSGCDSIATLVLTVSPTLTSTTNTAICTNQLPYTWNGQTINAAGTYTANLTSVSGCDSIAKLVLTVSPTLTSTTNTAICTNQLPYTWNGQTINAAGTYTANLTSVSGCDSIATLVLTVSPVLSSTTNTAICTNQLPYTWNGQTINAAGTYTANLTSISGCDSIATLVLAVSPTLTSTTNTAICTNQLPYTWNGQIINAAGTYTANLTSVSGCDSIATLVLAVSPTLTSTTNTAICTNQLPYTWNGQIINAAGTYTANLTSVSGCDSIATLVLTVSPTLTSTTNTAICTNQLPYTWNGQTINAGGTYTANLTSVSGCDSIATLVLTVSPTLTSTTNTAICTNQLPYTWNGQTINAAGTYTANLTSVSGCDSIASLVLTVSPTLTSTTNTAICTNQLPYTWNGQTINAAGTYTANLTSVSGCDSIATLVLTVSPTLTSTTNTAICTNQLPYTWNGQTINAAGTYTANLTSVSGCDSIATLVLTVSPTLTSTTNTAICTNQLPYTWNGQTINAAGTYTANLTNVSGCDSIATLVLTVSPTLTSTTNAAICTNQLPYTWNGQTINAAGTYTANLTAASGCDSIATLVLAVSPMITSTTNTAICTNQLPYTWNGQTINATGTYTANLTSVSGCDSIATLVLTVSPMITSTTNTAICTNQLPYTWNGQAINAAGTYTANLTATSGCDSVATLNLTVNPAVTSTTNTAICTSQLPYTWNGQTINAAGNYTSNLTAASGCDSIATLVLTVSPAVTSTTNTAICTNQLPYTWNGQTINSAGTYTANLTAASGCDSIATLVLTVSPTLTSTTNTAICTNQLPYTWNGQTINAAGTYTANLTSVSGCDSIATLVLTVSPTLTSTTNTAICTNQLPYTWNGQTINAAGTYTANLTSVSGCDSIATLVLTVSPTLTSTTNTVICTNQLPYTWNGQTINAAGTYTANLTSVSDCDSIATLVLTVSPTLTSTTNTAICTNQLPYTWNGQTINAAGTYTANLTSVSGCDSIATLVLTATPTLTSTTNTAICTNQLPYAWNGQTINAAGTYTANLTSVSGCDSIATLVLTVSPTLNSTTNTAICTNQLPYTWNGQTINAAGTYTANLTSVSGCDSIATLVLTVSPTLTSTTNTAICTNQLPYAWNGQTINAAGTYTANLTSVSGCDSIATLVLTATPTLTSTTNTAICTNQLPYAWNGQAISAAGTYTANLTAASGCDSIATLVLTVSPTLTSTTNTAICTNQLPYTWNGQTINAAGTYTANLTSVSGCDSIATLVLTVSPTLTSTTNTAICTNQLPYTWNGQTINAAGTYTANLTSVSGCDSIATLVLTVSPTLTSTTNTAICTNQLPYTWNGQTINAAGTYTANLTSISGCDSIATLVLTVSPTLTSTTNTAICTNQLPYLWNGQSINAAGTYTANLTSVSGCDSIATLILTVVTTLTSTTNTAICTNQLPYTWNGQTINAAGTYTANLTSVSGCDSIATLILDVSTTLTSTINTAICSNQLPYTWNGQSINTAGTYTANLISISGCDSIATLILTINPVSTSTTNTTICSTQLPYSWNAQTINTAGTYTAMLTNSVGCDSVATLVLTVNPAAVSTTNITVCANQIPYTWNGQVINSAGTYTATLTSQNGCDSIATLIFIIVPTVTSTTNITICSNELPYSWNGQSLVSNGTYTAFLLSAAGCDSIATLNLTVTSTLTSTTNTTVCANQLPYSWNGQSINAAGTYTANLTSVGGCDSIATLILTVTPVLTSTTNTTICTNQLPYTWNGQSINAAGNYTANLIGASGCDSIATLVLTVSAALSSTTNTIICSSQLPYSWNGQSINAAGSYTANLKSISGCDSIATLVLSVNPVTASSSSVTICSDQLPYRWNGQTINSAGSYTAHLTNANGCDSIATLALTVEQSLQGLRYPAVTTQVNVPVQLSARNLGINYTYNWNPGVGLNTYTIYNPIFTYDKQTEYRITITSNAGCTTVDTLLVRIPTPTARIESAIYVPSAWSPNGDGYNDKLTPLPVNIQELKYFRVFNRWGQLLFETTILNDGWDGTYKGAPQVSDTYTWTLEAVGMDGKVYKEAGNAVLLR